MAGNKEKKIEITDWDQRVFNTLLLLKELLHFRIGSSYFLH